MPDPELRRDVAVSSWVPSSQSVNLPPPERFQLIMIVARRGENQIRDLQDFSGMRKSTPEIGFNDDVGRKEYIRTTRSSALGRVSCQASDLLGRPFVVCTIES
ncbi:hypothetical protein BDZ89DRAFT_181926 [Hymenopellis radicata]|nr:hypothetical protein BDZ89DRAFT_181926 [Hymenopellis radicata]